MFRGLKLLLAISRRLPKKEPFEVTFSGPLGLLDAERSHFSRNLLERFDNDSVYCTMKNNVQSRRSCLHSFSQFFDRLASGAFCTCTCRRKVKEFNSNFGKRYENHFVIYFHPRKISFCAFWGEWKWNFLSGIA